MFKTSLWFGKNEWDLIEPECSVQLYIADLLRPVARNLKKLDAKGSRRDTIEQLATTSTPLPERFIGQDFSVFLVLITFSWSLQKCLQIAVFLYLYPLEQCAPSKCSSHLSIFNLLYHPPSLPPGPPLRLQAFVLKLVKFPLCILISEKLSPSNFSLNS